MFDKAKLKKAHVVLGFNSQVLENIHFHSITAFISQAKFLNSNLLRCTWFNSLKTSHRPQTDTPSATQTFLTCLFPQWCFDPDLTDAHLISSHDEQWRGIEKSLNISVQLPSLQLLDVTGSCIFTLSEQLSLPRSLRLWWVTGQVSLGGERSRGRGSGEGDLPPLCVRAQFTRADDQHPRGVHPIQSHLRVQTEPRDEVLQVCPRLLPPLGARTRQRSRNS